MRIRRRSLCCSSRRRRLPTLAVKRLLLCCIAEEGDPPPIIRERGELRKRRKRISSWRSFRRLRNSGRGRHVGQVRARLQPAELAISMAGNVATSSTYAGGTQQHKKEKGREAAAIGIGMACLGPGCSKRHQLLGALNMEESREGGKEERGRRLLGCCCWLPTIGDRSREERGDSSSSSSSPSRKCW